MYVTSQETENQDKINMMVAEKVGEKSDIQTFEFFFITFPMLSI